MQKNDKAIECKKECEALAKEYAQLKRNLKSALSAAHKSLKALNKRGHKLRQKADKVLFDQATSESLIKGANDLIYMMEDIEDKTIFGFVDDVTENWA